MCRAEAEDRGATRIYAGNLSISEMNSEKYPRSSIEDDFNYGTNVATASVQIRMGEYRMKKIDARDTGNNQMCDEESRPGTTTADPAVSSSNVF